MDGFLLLPDCVSFRALCDKTKWIAAGRLVGKLRSRAVPGKRNESQQLRNGFNYAIFDEFHGMHLWYNRGWRNVSRIPSMTESLHLGATILNDPKDLVGPFMAAEAAHVSMTEKGKQEVLPYYTTQHKQLNAKMKMVLVKKDRPCTATKSWLAVQRIQGLIPVVKNLTKHVTKTGALEDYKPGKKSSIPQKEITGLKAYIEDITHRFDVDTLWQMEPSWGALPVVSFAPMNAFDISVPIPEMLHVKSRDKSIDISKACSGAYKSALKAAVSGSVRTEIDDAGNNVSTFSLGKLVKRLHTWRIYSIFPVLLTLNNKVKDDFFAHVGKPEAIALINSTSNEAACDRLDEYLFPLLDELPVCKIIRAMVTQTGATLNKHGKPRKLVVGASLPMNVALVYWYVHALARLHQREVNLKGGPDDMSLLAA
jgi:hypothetical protein